MSARLRVAHVITRLNIGGPAQVVLMLAARLDPTQFESVVLAGETDIAEGDWRELERDPLAVVQHVPGLVRSISPLRDLAVIVSLYRSFRRYKPDIVHTNLSKAGLLGRVAARAAGVPVVVHTFHGNVLRGYFADLASRAVRSVEHRLAMISDALIAISTLQATELQAFHIATAEKVRLIPLGIDLTPYLGAPTADLRGELGLPNAAQLVGIVARLVPIKAVDVFVDAAAQVARERTDVHFVVVGDGELRAEIARRVVELGLAGRCHLVGWRADLPSVYADLDVVVLTSRNEGTPLAMIEALASARPTVATAVGGVPDVVVDGETGLLVPANDPKAVADAVLRLLADKELALRLGSAGRRRMLDRHDIDHFVEATERLYLELAQRRRASRARSRR